MTDTDQQRRPRLKRTVERIEAPEGDLILMRTTAGDVRVSGARRPERDFLGALDGSLTTTELERRFGAKMVRGALPEMERLGLIEDAAADERLREEVRRRFDRQLRYFGDVAGPRGASAADCQLRLAAARVAILGVGGLGGRVALDLASVGVGELWLADGDRVELSNLNRQIQFVERDIGRLKVERMAARLRAFNSDVVVRERASALASEEEIAAFVDGADLLVDAADWPTHQIERRCNAVCFRLGVPYIALSHFPPVARVGPLYVPGETGCFACQEAGFRREFPLYDVAVEQRQAKPLPAATLGPACGLVAGLLSTDVMHYLTGVVPPLTLGSGYTLDLRTFELERYEVVPEPGCPVCSARPRQADMVVEAASS